MKGLLVAHVLAAIAGMGPEFAFGIMGPAARRRGARTALSVYWAMSEARARVVYPAIALQVASGIGLILLGHHSVLHEPWLAASLVCYALAIAIVAVVLIPGSRKARRFLAEGIDPVHPSTRPFWRLTSLAGGIAGTLLVLVAVLMVWKPGA